MTAFFFYPSIALKRLGAGVLVSASLVMLQGCASPRQAVPMQPLPFDLKDVMQPDPSSLGYKVDNHTMRFKVHKVLPQRSSLDNGGMIDERYRLANLITDVGGNYEHDPEKKVVTVDTQTGVVKPTPYVGTILCFAEGNLALTIYRGKSEDSSFSYGKYGQTLQVWERTGSPPKGQYLNPLSCTLEAIPPWPQKDGASMKIEAVHYLRPKHGQVVVIADAPRPGNSPDVSADVKALMQKPFMQGMGLAALTAQWYLIKPDGEQVSIPSNPGEALTDPKFIPYLNAYFTWPGKRPLTTDNYLGVPVFARLIYPDGHVDRFDIPDVIQIPRQRGEIVVGYGIFYTKVGLIWKISYKRYGSGAHTTYRGDLEEGYYLQQKDRKALVKLPDLLGLGPINDGCSVLLKYEVVQRKPGLLFNNNYINICTRE